MLNARDTDDVTARRAVVVPVRCAESRTTIIRIARVACRDPAARPLDVRGDGVDILTFRPTKRYQNVVLSSPLLTRASGYAVYLGEVSTGTEKDGLFTGGVHTGGSPRATFSVNGTQTAVNVNRASAAMPGRARRRRRPCRVRRLTPRPGP